MKPVYALYHWGTACLPRLCVALYSFRVHHPHDTLYVCIPEWDHEASSYVPALVDAFQMQPVRVQMPTRIEGGIKNMAKMFCVDALPVDTHVALYESDVLFLRPTHDLFQHRIEFGMCPVPSLYWGSEWMHKRLAMRRWNGFPWKAAFLAPTERMNAGLWYIKPRSAFCAQFWNAWHTAGRRYADIDPKFPCSEEHLANALVHTELMRHPRSTLVGVLPSTYNLDIRFAHAAPQHGRDAAVWHFVENSFLTRHKIPASCADIWWHHFAMLKQIPALAPLLAAFPRWHQAYGQA